MKSNREQMIANLRATISALPERLSTAELLEHVRLNMHTLRKLGLPPMRARGRFAQWTRVELEAWIGDERHLRPDVGAYMRSAT